MTRSFGRLLRPLSLFLSQGSLAVGGQAVMEGVMMRHKDRLAIAVRRPDGSILLEMRPWVRLFPESWVKKPFLRGFPVLVETMVNGIKALNFSAEKAVEDGDPAAGPGGELKPWHLALTLVLAVGLALGLFVVLPHLLSLLLAWLGLSGGVEALSFHLWDGAFKLAIFLAYLSLVSLAPDIRRVFEYHGAEHKVIWAYEQGRELSPGAARAFSRLHPRCGTAFLLFVLSISILLHAVFIPALAALWAPATPALKQAYLILVKLALIAPISAMAYEIIRYAGKHTQSPVCRFLCWPGLALQRLTTFEPDDAQLEVAIAALKGALDGRG